MKNTKSTIKFFLVIALFASNALADGQMNSGGKTCNPQIQTCIVAQQSDDKSDDKEDSIFTFVKEFLASLLG